MGICSCTLPLSACKNCPNYSGNSWGTQAEVIKYIVIKRPSEQNKRMRELNKLVKRWA
jgi:hypothetical protein